ncbi:MAG: YgiT-type zinc finger protein [Tepidisphaerales bacterium]
MTKCPICGGDQIERVRESVELHPRGGAICVPDVEFDRCVKCGEMFFDHTASQKIDAVVDSAKRPRARRKSA